MKLLLNDKRSHGLGLPAALLNSIMPKVLGCAISMRSLLKRGLIGALFSGFILLSPPASSQEDVNDEAIRRGKESGIKLECVHGIDLKSKYVTMRGIQYSEGPVFHAYGTYGWKGFNFTHWYDAEPGKERPIKEIDFDLHYEREIGEDVRAKAGFMETYLPYEDFLFLHSLYGEVEWEGPAELTVFINRDWWSKERGLLGKIKIGKNFSLSDKIDIELEAQLTYNHEDFKPVSDFSHASVSGALSFNMGNYSLKVMGYHQEPLNGNFKREYWAGIGITM